MAAELEVPSSEANLYLSRGDGEITPGRPLMTGDVLSGIEIPGLEDGAGLAIVMTHPCSMRTDGVNLAERLLVARVSPYRSVPLSDWTGHLRMMPLPGLFLSDEDHYAARFDEIGLVRSYQLSDAERIACLAPLGISLLQQRFIKNLTRLTVPASQLFEVFDGVFEEAELQEEWVNTEVEQGKSVEEGSAAFHDWIREVDSTGLMRQEQIADLQRRASIRREMRARLNETASGR